jgi:hypothetical protein
MATKVVPQNGVAGKAPVSDGANDQIDDEQPYVARIVIEGVAPLLMHNYNVESVAEKGKAAKGSKAKKTDDVESYVYRVSPTDRRLGIPGSNFCSSMQFAAKSMQDPRSPRKSMMDLVKASVIPLDPCAVFLPHIETWDYIDKRRVVVQRNAVPRERPAMNPGWRVSFDILVNAPEYIPPMLLLGLANKAGMFQGLLDYRPTFGRFNVVEFKHGTDAAHLN